MGSFETNRFHPVLRRWFQGRFGQPTDIQTRAWKSICAGEHTLIASPTGTGKTLAALLPCLDRTVKIKQDANPYVPGVRVLYITPLKALNNDIHHHLFHFLHEIETLAIEQETGWPGINVGVRTGDTPSATRSSMLRRPPDLLITTPESLYILMTSQKARNMLQTVEQVIIDEIHDLAADKRGTHLSLTLERLVEWCGRSPQRIGVSATQKPLERVALYVGGWEPVEVKDKDEGSKVRVMELETQKDSADRVPEYRPRPVTIIESLVDKKIELTVTMPDLPQLGKNKEETVWVPLVERVLQLIEGSETVLIFVNSRRLCERLTLRINDHVGYEMARSHHGSVSREKRLEVERMLKDGELRILVATSSLELGIDVGHVDLVIQVDSPKQAAAGIQRIGRAGHSVGGASRGVVLARTRGELAEAAVLSRRIAARDIEEIRIPRHSLDVLSQQVVAMIATDDWELGRLHAAIARSDCYRGFPRAKLEAMLQVLAGYYPFARPLIEWDRETGRLHRRKNSSMAAVMGAGTIPQSTAYAVHHADSRIRLGDLEEEFVHESRVGDVFQLGTSSWMIRSIKQDRIYVSETDNSFSEIPFWKGEANGRSFELGQSIGRFYADMLARMEREEENRLTRAADGGNRPAAESTVLSPHKYVDTIEWLAQQYCMDARSAEQLITLVKGQKAASEVPTDRKIVVEKFKDDMSQTHLIVHTTFGRKFHRTWLLALQRHFVRILPFPVYSNAKENGIEFTFPDWDDSWLRSIWSITGETFDELLAEAIPGSPMFGGTFRRLAETSLLLARGFSRIPAWKQRMRSEQLLKEAMPFADRFPLLREAMDECLQELLDVQTVKKVLDAVQDGEIQVSIVNSHFPSPFSGQFLADFINQKMYESDALGTDLQFQLMGISKQIAVDWFGHEALKNAIDPEVLKAEKLRLEGTAYADEEVQDGQKQPHGTDFEPDQLAPISREESLYRLLKERGDLTAEQILKLAGPDAGDQIAGLQAQGKICEISIQGERRWICTDERDTYASLKNDAASLWFVAGRHIDHALSFTEQQIQHRYELPVESVRSFMEYGLQQGLIERAPFADHNNEELWSSKKIVSRLLTYSLQHFRKQAEPSEAAAYCKLLAERHHMTAPARLSGQEGLLSVVSLLQGVFLPLSYWETLVLPSRMTDYRKEYLDLACASGELFWIGKKEPHEKEGSIAFFLTEAKELYAPYLRRKRDSQHPELLGIIKQKGASFLTSLCRETGETPSDLMAQLIDLVWEGHISNDQFSPLRMHGAAGSNKRPKFQSGLGRWYALDSLDDAGISAEKAAAGWVKHLLEQQGVIAKDSLPAECPFSWDTLQGVIRQLEDWGMVARGLFLHDVGSIQFSTKETVALLRQTANRASGGPFDPNKIVLLSAVDPINPYGVLVKWPEKGKTSFARKPGNYLVMCDDEWIVWIENNGKRMHSMIDVSSTNNRNLVFTAIQHVMKTMFSRQKLRKIVVEAWNGQPAANSEAAGYLEQAGAERDRNAYVLWPSSFK